MFVSTKNIKILTISGSLRSDSANTFILKSIATLKEKNIDFHLFEGLDKLPHFNPDLDGDNPEVTRFRSEIHGADGIVICTPEYAFGVPGVLKNALDWTVSSGEFNEKPVAAISVSPLNSGGDKALASLLFTLTALGTIYNDKSSLSIPNIKQKISQSGTITDASLQQSLLGILENLLEQIHSRQIKN